MKHTKKLYTKLYIVTLYSNLIIPLRRSFYIQLLYEDLSKKLAIFFQQIRWLVWQENKNGLRQFAGRLRAVLKTIVGWNLSKIWTVFEAKNATEMSLKCHQKIRVSRQHFEAKKLHQPFIDLSSEKYHQMTTEIPPKNEGKVSAMCGQKIGSPKVVIENQKQSFSPLTIHHRLILLNSSFMLCY